MRRGLDKPDLEFGCSRRTAVCGHGATVVRIRVPSVCIWRKKAGYAVLWAKAGVYVGFIRL